MPAARITHLCVSFGTSPVLRDISLDIARDGISVLIGRSGSGKTTLLRAMNRLNELFPDCRTRGQVELDLGNGLEPVYPEAGRAPGSVSDLRRRAGMVFQTPGVLPVSILRNITIPLRAVLGCPRPELTDRARAALKAVRLWDEVGERLELPADRLSGGQQQRLCLARALALEPAVLLLDEPTASLDARTALSIEDLLLELSQTRPVIMVSHSLAQAARVGKYVHVLASGTLIRSLAAPFTEAELAGLLEEERLAQG